MAEKIKIRLIGTKKYYLFPYILYFNGHNVNLKINRQILSEHQKMAVTFFPPPSDQNDLQIRDQRPKLTLKKVVLDICIFFMPGQNFHDTVTGLLTFLYLYIYNDEPQNRTKNFDFKPLFLIIYLNE